jgi:hypothetical protein
MELVSRDNFKNTDVSAMPYFFSTGYEAFLNLDAKSKYFLVYSSDINAFMPVSKLRVSFFNLLQIIYPPVTLKGERLSADREKLFLMDFVSFIKKKISEFALYNPAAIVYSKQCQIIPLPVHSEHTY